MISHTKKFIFIYIPKTGETSVEFVFRKHGILLQGEKNFRNMYYKHATAKDIKEIHDEIFHKYYKFTIVRNPYDWVVSNYAFNRGLAGPYVIDSPYMIKGSVPDWAKMMSFSNWLKWWIETFYPSQSVMFTDEDGNSLVDSIFRVESLSTYVMDLKRRFGLFQWWPNLPWLKRSRRHSDYRKYYDDESRKLVENHFGLDFHFWNACE